MGWNHQLVKYSKFNFLNSTALGIWYTPDGVNYFSFLVAESGWNLTTENHVTVVLFGWYLKKLPGILHDAAEEIRDTEVAPGTKGFLFVLQAPARWVDQNVRFTSRHQTWAKILVTMGWNTGNTKIFVMDVWWKICRLQRVFWRMKENDCRGETLKLHWSFQSR